MSSSPIQQPIVSIHQEAMKGCQIIEEYPEKQSPVSIATSQVKGLPKGTTLSAEQLHLAQQSLHFLAKALDCTPLKYADYASTIYSTANQVRRALPPWTDPESARIQAFVKNNHLFSQVFAMQTRESRLAAAARQACDNGEYDDLLDNWESVPVAASSSDEVVAWNTYDTTKNQMRRFATTAAHIDPTYLKYAGMAAMAASGGGTIWSVGALLQASGIYGEYQVSEKPKDKLQQIMDSVPDWRDIETLSLPSEGCTDETVNRVCQGDAAFRYLDLWDCNALTDASLHTIANHASEQLEALHINSPEFTAEGLLDVCERCPNLKALTISANTKLSPEDLLTALQRLPKLESLAIRGFTDLDPDKLVTTLITHCKNLTKLRSDTACTEQHLMQIAEAYPKIQSLDLYTKASDVELIALATHCPELKKLNVGGEPQSITDKSIVLLAQNCQHLQELDLPSGCHTTNAALDALLKHRMTLTRVIGLSASLESIKAFVEACDHLEFFDVTALAPADVQWNNFNDFSEQCRDFESNTWESMNHCSISPDLPNR